ncbi:type II toxin-antitoxin system YafQ family toxin, partial [Klebsiella pneumoniae]|uniref:type II toxin-antitoxin system YafQ family toxin n=1 Tax=Klebsiella pneumoniae TaxID=573 RepID=UPI001E2AC11E|nr:type II toxin-antitoxin system YafQ family toxin [Klebsiella pneumoniae]
MQSSIERTVSGVRCTNDDLKPVLVALATDQPLDVRYRDHDLSGTVAKLAMRQPFVLFKGLTFQKLCL